MLNRRERKLRKEFEKIYDSNVRQIFRFAYLKVSSKDDAEDITSRAFIRVWDSLKKTEELENPRAFVYRITRNLVIDYYRKNRNRSPEDSNKPKHVPLDDVVVLDKELPADEKAILATEMEEVKRALKEINEDYQNIIIWYYLDELTVTEIAELLEKPEASVRVLIHRAVNSLKKELKHGKKGKSEKKEKEKK